MKLFSFTVENDWLQTEHGWGNGYVAVPPEHSLYGKSYKDKVKVKDTDKIPFNGNFIGLLSAAFDKEDKDENLIPLDLAINVHGGITLSKPADNMKRLPSIIPKNYWIFGFDTAHAGDDQINWTKEDVRKETKKFKKQLENFK